MTTKTRVEIIDDDTQDVLWSGTLTEFFEVNEFADAELQEIRDAIEYGDDYAIGGGAAPLVWLRAAPDSIDNVTYAAGYAYACGYHD